MAYRPRTPEDMNRLAAAAAEYPSVAAHRTTGTDDPYAGMVPAGHRLATPADAGTSGLTLADIQRMMNSPSRYGELYVPDTKQRPEAKGAPKRTAVDNEKRTRTRSDQGAKKTGAPTPPQRPQSAPNTQELDPSSPLWPLGLAGGAAALYGASRLKGRGPTGVEGVVDAGVPPQLAGPAAMTALPPPGARGMVPTDAERGIVNAIGGADNITDAQWTDAFSPRTIPTMAAGDLPAPPNPLAAPMAALAAPRAALPMPDAPPEAARATGEVIDLPPPSAIIESDPRLKKAVKGKARAPRKTKTPTRVR